MNGIGQTILVVAAHPDDEVLGCGGSIARCAREGHAVHLLVLADGVGARGDGRRAAAGTEAVAGRRRAAEAAAGILGIASTTLLNFPDNRMDGVELLDVVKAVECVLDAVKPDCVMTHHGGDVNIDHHVAYEAVLAACRPQPGHGVRQLLSFEVPSSTEWRPAISGPAFSPNFFIDISDTLDAKLRALQAYGDEVREFPHPRSVRAVEALARWRGASCGVAAAEAFCLARQIL